MSRRVMMISTAAILLLAAVCVFLNPAAAYIFARAHGLDLKYSRLTGTVLTGLSFKDLTASDPKKGFGLFAETADVKIVLSKNILAEPGLDLDLRGGRFLREGMGPAEDYADLDDLVALPFKKAWRYRRITARLRALKDGTGIDDLYAESDEIRLYVNGAIHRDNYVNLAIKISFAETVTSKIPEALSKVFLNDEGTGWKSLSVSLSGNYAAPSIQVSSKLFRLSVKSVSESHS